MTFPWLDAGNIRQEMHKNVHVRSGFRLGFQTTRAAFCKPFRLQNCRIKASGPLKGILEGYFVLTLYGTGINFM
jgi:hypothetical protein